MYLAAYLGQWLYFKVQNTSKTQSRRNEPKDRPMSMVSHPYHGHISTDFATLARRHVMIHFDTI